MTLRPSYACERDAIFASCTAKVTEVCTGGGPGRRRTMMEFANRNQTRAPVESPRTLAFPAGTESPFPFRLPTEVNADSNADEDGEYVLFFLTVFFPSTVGDIRHCFGRCKCGEEVTFVCLTIIRFRWLAASA